MGDQFVHLNLTSNFPIADLAISPTEVINTKRKGVKFNKSAVLAFMKRLETRKLTIYVALQLGEPEVRQMTWRK